MYNTIINPITNRKINIKSKLGINIIKKYLNQLLIGGAKNKEFCEMNIKTNRCIGTNTDPNDDKCIKNPKTSRCIKNKKKKSKTTEKIPEITEISEIPEITEIPEIPEITERKANFYNISKEINPNYGVVDEVIDRSVVDIAKIHQNVELFIKEKTQPGDILFIGDTYHTRQEYGFLIVGDNLTGRWITDDGFYGMFSLNPEEFKDEIEFIYNNNILRKYSGVDPVPKIKVDFTDVANYIYNDWNKGHMRLYSYIDGQIYQNLPEFFGEGYPGWIDPIIS